MSQASNALVLLLSDDLIFTSQIAGYARSHRAVVRTFATSAALVKSALEQVPNCVILDLANPGLDVRDLITRLRETGSPAPRVVAYGSHVDASGLKAAREAGCDPVLPRSKFVEDLPRELPTWLNTLDTSGS